MYTIITKIPWQKVNNQKATQILQQNIHHGFLKEEVRPLIIKMMKKRRLRLSDLAKSKWHDVWVFLFHFLFEICLFLPIGFVPRKRALLGVKLAKVTTLAPLLLVVGTFGAII